MIQELPADLTLYARGEVIGYGRFFYDATNGQSQPRYTIADFRLGVEGSHPLPFTWRADLWVRNAVDESYVPIAFPFPLATSGYVGESGAPRTFGATLQAAF